VAKSGTYETQLAEFEAKKKRICEMREDGSYTKEEFLERRQEIENQVIEFRTREIKDLEPLNCQ
jgi:hypothetical protein